MDVLPYAIMCELKELAGDNPSTNFKPIGTKRPSPEALNMRRAYLKPLSVRDSVVSYEDALKPTSKFETSASLQDLVDFGLIEHGFWHDGTTTYGFHLTEKAMQYLKSSPATT